MTNAKDTRIGSGGKIAFELGRRCHGNAARILGPATHPKARHGFLRGANPEQRNTGRRGYLGKLESVKESSQR